MKRLISMLLLLAMLLSCLPVSVSADDTAITEAEEIVDAAPAEDADAEEPPEEEPLEEEIPTEETPDEQSAEEEMAAVLSADGESFFYFSAETKKELLIAPRKVPFTAGQRICDALEAAGITLKLTSDGFLSAINGVAKGYTVLSAPSALGLLNGPEAGGFVCVTENKDTDGIGEGWQLLMKQMVQYLQEAQDVRLAAKNAYDAACQNYCGVSDEDAKTYAQAIQTAISEYKTAQDTLHSVTFGGSFSGCEITAESSYGKQFEAESDGTLRLPNGTYTFFIRNGNRSVSGTLTVKDKDQKLTDLPALPTHEWIDTASFALSKTSDYNNKFDEERFTLTASEDGYTQSAAVPDTFSGNIYPYFCLSADGKTAGASITANYRNTAGETVSESITTGAKNKQLTKTLLRGASGNTVVFRVSVQDGSYAQNEELTLKLDRQPTLSGLYLEGKSGTRPAADKTFSGTELSYTYKILEEDTTVTVYPTAAFSGYTVTVDDQALDGTGGATVKVTSKKQDILVSVSQGDYETVYTLTVEQGASTYAQFEMIDKGIEFRLTNENGEELVSREEINDAGNIVYFYTVVSGQKYTYFATLDTYYHAEKTFTADAAADIFEVSVPRGSDAPQLEKVSFGELIQIKHQDTLPLIHDGETGFSAAQLTYTVTVPDASGSFYVWADPATGTTCKLLYQAIFDTKPGVQRQETPAKTSARGTPITDAILSGNVHGNTLTFRASKEVTDTASGGDGKITYSTGYVVTVKRSLTLSDLSVSCGGNPVTLNYDTDKSGFQSSQTEYTINVPGAAGFVDLTLGAHDGVLYGEDDSGYLLFVNGEEAAPDAVFQATLSGGMETETITVTVKSRADDTISTDYKLTVKKEASTSAKITVTPADATLYIYEKVSGIRLWPDTNSKYCFSTGFTYVYSATKSGYVGQSGAIQLLDGKLDFGSIQKNEDETETFVSGTKYDPSKAISLKLDTAPKNNTIQTGMAAQWADFRGTAYTEGGAMTGTANTNNGVTSAAIPFSAESGTLYWAVNAGTGYSSNAVSNPILVDGNVVVYTGTRILKIDKDTGAILSEGTMAGKSSFAINNPTYAEGVILVGLSDGRIQAFNADTLESLWLYTDPLGGQPDSPITVANGYAYTGFWNSEVEEASFVCLSLTDEDPASKLEAKAETWRYVQKGGFYWAGAYACEDYVLIGTDDGEDGYSSDTANLLLLDPKSGKLLDSMTGFTGDIRCSICYDTATKAFYFTSKGGYLYSVQVQKSGSSWKLANKKQLELGGMSTSTPVVHNGRAYIGVSGAGQFTPYSGHNITVVNLSNMSAAYRMPTQGYPQTSGLLTTAYEKSGSGYVYVYFFDNYTPGKLRVLRDKAGQTTAEYTSDEYAEKTKYTTAYELFTPVAPQMQYALCSPIVDENGTLYFKNDSGYLMAYGSMVESLSMDAAPTKTEYEAGEKFDPAGLKVTATYANGITRDVTKLMKAADKALTQADTSVTLIYGLGQTMYHNVENTDKTMKPGEETASKSIAIGITVGNSTLTGTIGDLNWSFSAKTSKLNISGSFPSGASLIAAVYTADGKMVGTKILTAEGEAELPTGAKIKLFLLDTNGKPLCQSATVKGA